MSASLEQPFGHGARETLETAAPPRYVSMFGRTFSVPLLLRNLPGNIAIYSGLAAVIWCLVPVLGYFVALPVGLLAVLVGLAGYVGADLLVATNQSRALWGAILGLISFVLVGFGGGRYW